MTLDEAIKYFEEMVEIGETYDVSKIVEENSQLLEWLKDYKRLLEQQSCEDAISRQAVLNALYALCDTGETLNENPWRDNPHIDAVIETIEELPPVTPQPKTGHWIDDNDEIDAQYGRHLYRCSECNEYADMFVGGTEDWWDLEKPNYCPNCGVKMG